MDFENIISQLLENPSLAATFLSPLVDRYMPLVSAAADELFKAGNYLQESYVNSGYPLAAAKARKAKYDAYIEAGFTPDQAMSLLLTDIRQTATLAKGDLFKAANTVTEAIQNA